jgi:hypothetical protein
MTFKTTYKDPSKITVTLPRALLVRLDEYVPSRRRSRFIAQAIESRLALAEQLTALDETAGAWTDDNHPDMKTEADIDRWIDDIRASWSASRGEQRG